MQLNFVLFFFFDKQNLRLKNNGQIKVGFRYDCDMVVL